LEGLLLLRGEGMEVGYFGFLERWVGLEREMRFPNFFAFLFIVFMKYENNI
jgi:hypothetical protein